MKILSSVAAAMLATGMAGSAGAAVTVRDVAVENASFENPVLSDGAFFRTSIPGWTASGRGGAGYFNPPAAAGFQPTDGANVANIDSFQLGGDVDGAYTQLLTESITADTIYTLAVDVIRRADVPQMGIWFAEIVAADTLQVVGAQAVAQATLADEAVPLNGFRTLSFSYTGTTADVGRTLGIRFRSVYDQAQNGEIRQVLLDNVRMTATADIAAAVPEPATWAMMILGFGMVGMAVRRRGTVPTVYA